MKKFLSILLLLAMCCGMFVACGDNTNDPAETAATLEEAIEYLTSTYKSDDGKATPADYKLIAKIPVGETTFEVTWTVDNEAITITLVDGLYNVDVPVKNDTEVPYTLTATVKDASGKTETKTFTRVLPVYDSSASVEADDIKENTPYKLFLVQANLGKTLFATTEVQGDNKYIKTTIDPKAGADFYAEKVEGGYKFYTEIDGVKNYVHAATVDNNGKISKYIGYATESDCVYYYKAELRTWFVKINKIEYGVGTYNTFDTVSISEGTYFKADTVGVSQYCLALMNKAAAEELTPTEGPKDPTELTSITDFLTIAGKLAHDATTPEKYLVKGVIVEIKNTPYGNAYIQDEAGNKLYVYGLYSKDGSTRFDKMDPQPKVGDTVTLMGVASMYNETAQMKNAWVTELVAGVAPETTPTTTPTTTPETNAESAPAATESGAETNPVAPAPTENVPVIPEAGTNYKLYFVQKNKDNTIFYMTGVLDGYYMGSTEKAAEGADFALEAVEGGYSLYCTVDGAKKYVNVVKSGDYTNAKYEDAATTVWTIDETLKTVVATIEDGSYILGTKADGTYTTLGPMEIDSGCMYAQFVLPENAAETPEKEPEQKPSNPDAGLSEIKVDTPYYIAGVNANGNLYFDGTVKSGRIGGTSDKSKAVTVMLEAGSAAGEYYIYFMNGETKTYISGAEDKSAGLDLVTTKDDTCIWIIDTTAKTIISKNLGDRGIATQVTSPYDNFSSYASSNFSSAEYAVSWFVA